MLQFRSLCAVFVACFVLSAGLLSGCGGGSSVPGSGPIPSPGGAGIESIASANAALAAGGGCGLRTVFVYRTGTVRGYPLDAAGETQPCAVIPVSGWWGPISISRYGYLHVAEFQNGTPSYTVYAPNANGNAGPVRLVTANIDRFSLATDSHVTDFLADGEGGSSCWEAAVATGAGATQRICTTETATQVGALAVEPDDRLVVVLSDYAGPPGSSSMRIQRRRLRNSCRRSPVPRRCCPPPRPSSALRPIPPPAISTSTRREGRWDRAFWSSRRTRAETSHRNACSPFRTQRVGRRPARRRRLERLGGRRSRRALSRVANERGRAGLCSGRLRKRRPGTRNHGRLGAGDGSGLPEPAADVGCNPHVHPLTAYVRPMRSRYEHDIGPRRRAVTQAARSVAMKSSTVRFVCGRSVRDTAVILAACLGSLTSVAARSTAPPTRHPPPRQRK